jgi:hypothetical protein
MNLLAFKYSQSRYILSLNICLVVQKITYLSFYVSIKQKRNDQLIKPYKKKYTIKKKEKNMTIPIISTFYSVTDEQNERKDQAKKK